jgi:hypothetical protein
LARGRPRPREDPPGRGVPLLLAAADRSIDWKNRSHYQKAVQHLLEQ